MNRNKLSPFLGIADITNAAEYAQAVGLPMDPQGDFNALQPGELYTMANDSRFSQAYFAQPLTTFAVGGWNTVDLAAEVDAICGVPVEVPRNFSHKVWDNAEAFKSDVDEDLRAIGGDFKSIRLTTTEVNRKTLNRGLLMRLDVDEMTDIATEEQKAVLYIMNRLRLNQARRAAALIIAAGVNTARTWGSVANPDGDMRTTLRTAADFSGLRPNFSLFGDGAWDLRWSAYAQQATAGAFGGVPQTEESLARLLKLDQVFVSKGRYTSAAAAKTAYVGNLVLSYYKSMSGMKYDPSNIKRFYTPTAAGGPVRVFKYQVNDKTWVIGVEHFELIAITYTGGIRKETIS